MKRMTLKFIPAVLLVAVFLLRILKSTSDIYIYKLLLFPTFIYVNLQKKT